MVEINYLIEDDAYPLDRARRFIKRVRRAAFYISADFSLPSDEEGKVYPMYESIEVSARQMLKVLDHWEEFSRRKREAGQNGVRGVRFRVSVWEGLDRRAHYQVYMG